MKQGVDFVILTLDLTNVPQQVAKDLKLLASEGKTVMSLSQRREKKKSSFSYWVLLLLT